MNGWNIPIYTALKSYSDSRPVPFHMPGHKLGKGLPEEFVRNIHLMDVTEIPGTDNLHYPEGPIDEAQKLAARAFGADETFFLVNGSTVGIHAMIMALCNPGDKLIVARDCHKSAINGMMLAGVKPVYIKPQFNSCFGISAAVLPSDIETALLQNPDAQGVFITRPNYYGICSDIEAIAKIVHSHGKVLAVDEAHGAHLAFDSGLPVSAMQACADICVQSAHKTLPAFTQGSYLHVNRGRIDVEKLKWHLRLLQTTSPSYIIMASLDIARAIMENSGHELIRQLKQFYLYFYEKLKGSARLVLLDHSALENGTLDWTRMVVNVKGLGKTGYDIDKILRTNFNIQVEMSDLYNIVCITTVSDSMDDFKKLTAALLEIDRELIKQKPLADIYSKQPDIPAMQIDFRDVLGREGISVCLKDAAGHVCLDMITPYPPGIPAICPGEIVSEEIVEYLYAIINSGGTVTGFGRNFEIRVAK